jgi:purine-binding chemotaxis protein CheW
MDTQSHLVFYLGDTCYGLAAAAVREIFLLPALTAAIEASPAVAGVLNLRGQLLPVLHLDRSLGLPPQPNRIDQAVVLVGGEGQPYGLIVDRIQGVEAIATGDLTTHRDAPYLAGIDSPLTAGLAQYAGQVMTLINPLALAGDTGARPAAAIGAASPFMAQFDAAEQRVLGDRAAGLAQPLNTESGAEQSALAVVSLAGERFALALGAVHEFANVTQVTPIPCCPSHIVGNMNLRGEILTLVDVREFLNLSATPRAAAPKAVVLRLGDLVAGIVVDEVFDVVYVAPTDVAAMPTALNSRDAPYLRGVARYRDSMMSLIDLPTLFTQPELVVDQPG